MYNIKHISSYNIYGTHIYKDVRIHNYSGNIYIYHLYTVCVFVYSVIKLYILSALDVSLLV